MSKKIILTIGILILIILGVFVYLWKINEVNPSIPPASSPSSAPAATSEPSIAPTPTFNSDISDWKTYRNEKYGFELKYPKEYESNSDYSIWTLGDKGSILSEWGINKGQETVFGIDVYSKAEKTSLLNRFGNEVAGNQKLFINNIVAKKLEGGETSWNVLMIENENYIYIIISSFSPSNNSQGYNEYEAILSTFKFIK